MRERQVAERRSIVKGPVEVAALLEINVRPAELVVLHLELDLGAPEARATSARHRRPHRGRPEGRPRSGSPHRVGSHCPVGVSSRGVPWSSSLRRASPQAAWRPSAPTRHGSQRKLRLILFLRNVELPSCRCATPLLSNRRVFAPTRLRCGPMFRKSRIPALGLAGVALVVLATRARLLVLRRRKLPGRPALRMQRRHRLLPGVRGRQRLRSPLPQHGSLWRRVRRQLPARVPRRQRLLVGLRRQLHHRLPQHGLVRRLLRRELPVSVRQRRPLRGEGRAGKHRSPATTSRPAWSSASARARSPATTPTPAR